jgi:hypothetical protein
MAVSTGIRSGLSAYLGMKQESAYGTFISPDHFYEFLDESIAFTIDRNESKSLRASGPTTANSVASPNRVLRADRYFPGKKKAAGQVNLDVPTKGMGLIFANTFGASSITTPSGATNTRQHTYTLADTYGKSLSLEIGRPDNQGNVYPFQYSGMKVSALQLQSQMDQTLQAQVTFTGQNETIASSNSVPYYPTTSTNAAYELMYWTQGVISVGGTTLGNVTNFQFTYTLGLKDDRYFLGGATMSEPILHDFTMGEGSITVEWNSTTAYQRFLNNTTAQIEAKWTSSTAIEGSFYPYVDLVLPSCRFDGSTPAVKGPEVISHDLKFKMLQPTTDATSPLTLIYQTSDTAD